jgi:hypothetical protein
MSGITQQERPHAVGAHVAEGHRRSRQGGLAAERNKRSARVGLGANLQEHWGVLDQQLR